MTGTNLGASRMTLALLFMAVSVGVAAVCGNGSRTSQTPPTRVVSTCFSESPTFALAPASFNDLSMLAARAGMAPQLPSSPHGLNIVAAGVVDGADSDGLLVDFASNDRDRETVTVKYTPSPECLGDQAQPAVVGRVGATPYWRITQGQFFGYESTFQSHETAVLLRVVWFKDHPAPQQQQTAVIREWIQDLKR